VVKRRGYARAKHLPRTSSGGTGWYPVFAVAIHLGCALVLEAKEGVRIEEKVSGSVVVGRKQEKVSVTR